MGVKGELLKEEAGESRVGGWGIGEKKTLFWKDVKEFPACFSFKPSTISLPSKFGFSGRTLLWSELFTLCDGPTELPQGVHFESFVKFSRKSKTS